LNDNNLDRFKNLKSILSQEYQLGLNDQSVELGLDNLISNFYKDFNWIYYIYPMKGDSYKNLGIGERHIWVKNLISKINYEIKIIQERITRALILEKLPLETPIDHLPYISKRFISKFSNIGIFNLNDLLLHIPFRHENFTQVKPINLLLENESTTIIGIIQNTILLPNKSGARATQIIVSDNSGQIKATWFRQPYLIRNLRKGSKIALSGIVKRWKNNLQFTNPIHQIINNKNPKKYEYLLPYYNSTDKLSQITLRETISKSVQIGLNKINEFIPVEILERNDLFTLRKSIFHSHFSKNEHEKEKALRTYAFHEIFQSQISVKYRKKLREKNLTSYLFKSFEKNYNLIKKYLPFELTEDQKKSIVEIEKDLSSNLPMARLLQGEVGSGKTIVALVSLLCTAMEGKQGILLAPTEVLAEQHFINLCELVSANIEFGTHENIRIFEINKKMKICLLTGSLNNNLKIKTRKMIIENKVDIIIGTHALLQEDLSKNFSGLIVIDEQQRFGVDQRNLFLKRKPIPNMLAMSATPIPRTLALTIYGDLSLSTINTMPNRRRDVMTKWLKNSQFDEILDSIENELNSNSQVFYVCPFIDQSSKIEVSSVTQEFDRLKKSKLSKYKIALLHGRMKIDEKQKIMNMLRNGEIDILVSTPIIEVGVDISNATLIVINSADRFGISQLHQLRGRVGRGEKQSSCIIVSSDEINEITSKRLTALLRSNNGFTLAEEDLKIRGPGEVDQTKQSGWPEFKVANPLDFNLIEKVNKESERILSVDPELLDQKNEIIKNLLKNITSSDISLG